MKILLSLLYALTIKPLLLWYGDDGCGLTITFSSGFTTSKITNVSWNGISRKAIDKTNTASTEGWMEYFPACLKDAGQLEIDLLFDPQVEPPITGDAETITVTMPIPAGLTNAGTWACSGFLIDWSGAMPQDDKMSAKATIKFSGKPTYTAAT